jgi:hypothetical protein
MTMRADINPNSPTATLPSSELRLGRRSDEAEFLRLFDLMAAEMGLED